MLDDFTTFPSRAYPYALYYGPWSVRFYPTPAARAAAWATVQDLLAQTPHAPGQGEACCGDFTLFGPRTAGEDPDAPLV